MEQSMSRRRHDAAANAAYAFTIIYKELQDKETTLTGWWLSHPSEKYEFVNWDDNIPSTWKNHEK